MSDTPNPTQTGLKADLLRARDALAPTWWRFFDWLAVTSWGRVLLISLFTLIIADAFSSRLANLFFPLIFASFVIKIVAGGKRRADIAAKEATARADHESMERRVAECELATMQAQIEPHFLFNTLGSIEALIETDPPRAARTMANLIEYLRAAMPQMRDTAATSTLGQQVALSRAFLDIMKARMEERLTYAIAVPEGLSSAEFPPMMLQTLVENSIKHGLEPKAAGGNIDIRAEVAHGKLRVTVTDTGKGLSDGASSTAGTGVGLANVRDRLRLMFGNDASLTLATPAEGGAAATIEIPYRSVSAANDTAKASA